MDELYELGSQVGQILIDRHETIAVAESSAAGLISAALLSVPGASAYFVGSGVVYTRTSRNALLAIPEASLEGVRASTEAYALMLARAIRARLNTTWAIGETGATGPTGNRYGDAAGHACLAVCGLFEATRTLETGKADRHENMSVFAAGALRLFHEVISAVH
jgi:PncC family amidohydrolase